ncbi:MAG TPA: GTPase-associated system all-helical protein GASH [Planktothrix sp.]|jgi:hypothetical protein
MANESEFPMNPEFADWYNNTVNGLSRETTQRRWNAVKSITNKFDRALSDCLVHLVFGKKVDATQKGRFCEQLRAGDDQFGDNNERELQILAAASLATVMDTEKPIAAVSAMSIVTGSLNGSRQLVELPMDLLKRAEGCLRRMALVVRRRPELSDNPTSKVNTKIDGAKKLIVEPLTSDGVLAALEQSVQLIDSTINQTNSKLQDKLDRMSKLIAVQDEELEILWWAFGERSEAANASFHKIPTEFKPLALSNELASKTRFLPGPVSLIPILTRAGLSTDQMLTVPAAINSPADSWLESIGSESSDSTLLMPLHAAIYKKLETSDDKAWIESWHKSVGIDERQKFSTLNLAKQFYYECLLKRP